MDSSHSGEPFEKALGLLCGQSPEASLREILSVPRAHWEDTGLPSILPRGHELSRQLQWVLVQWGLRMRTQP